MMMFADESRGRPFSKDPAVVEFEGQYLMYYSLPPYGDGREADGWRIGIASSPNLDDWQKIGELPPLSPCDKNGLCAPGAVVLDGKVHLFYQTYGNGPKDAICHATSEDGIHFLPNSSNPIFSPTGDWTSGRAIDADVIVHEEKLFLYFSTRDPDMRIQMPGVATALLASGFQKSDWTQQGDGPLLYPELPWEGECIEASALCKHNGKLYMFYGGAYNNKPQQIGCAVSEDGLSWKRVADKPIVPNGKVGDWNSSESGHPFVLEASDGRYHLFFQGNNDNGKTWYLSRKEIFWDDNVPYVR
ncbi:MAG: family 43 glycosylhydrolase [Trueperaceae bacterium]|nr:family 43 glycosylhydrolase [Trueperaceae bacterium]